MARSKSSSTWMARHVSDPFVKKAQLDGYRSRSAYKLTELNEKDRLIRPGMRIMDLGSAPGGWSQVAGKLVGAKGRVLATDILPMEPIKNVDFIQGDFTDEAVVAQLLDWLGGGNSTSSSRTSRPTSPASIPPTRRRRCISSSSRSTPCARR